MSDSTVLPAERLRIFVKTIADDVNLAKSVVDALKDCGVLGWCILTEQGGGGLEPVPWRVRPASACLTSCSFSASDAACRRLRDNVSRQGC